MEQGNGFLGTQFKVYQWGKWRYDKNWNEAVTTEECFSLTCFVRFPLLTPVWKYYSLQWTGPFHRNHEEIATKVELTSWYDGSNISIEVLSSSVTLNCVKLAKLTSIYELHYYRIYSPNHALDKGYLSFFICNLF